MAPAVRRTPYKDFLQPALHRRFSSTATILLVVSYLEAVLLADWRSFFWSWFPIGPAGVRAFILFACGLAILVLRISQYHAGLRTSNAPIEIFTRNALKFQTLETLVCYTVSGLLFGLVFLWSAPDRANLHWVTYHSGDRARLNERPLFFICYLVWTAVWASVAHLYYDQDRLDLGSPGDGAAAKPSKGPLDLISKYLPQVFSTALGRGIWVTAISLVLYPVFQRHFVWGWAMFFLRPFYNLPKTNLLPLSWPYDVWIITRCTYAAFLVSILWISANIAFSVFMAREPLKGGMPLTSESKDPNGSLLNGLKSKKLSIQTFAMWELAFISRDFATRRLAIYEDIDRKDGPMWSQIYVICLSLIKGIESNMDDYGKPPAPPAKSEPAPEPKPRVAPPLKDDPVFQSKPASKTMLGEVERVVSKVARSPGHSPVAQLSPVAKKTLRTARDRVLTKEQQEALSPSHLQSQFHQWALVLLQYNVPGAWFRQDFRRRLLTAVFGTPYAEPSLYVNAAIVLSLLSVHSLGEDKFGNVHRDVPAIIRTFTSVIKKLEAFQSNFSVHWTDLSGNKKTPEVDGVLDALRTGLAQVMAEFEPYAVDLRLTPKDVRLAKEASAKPPTAEKSPKAEEPVLEMEHVR